MAAAQVPGMAFGLLKGGELAEVEGLGICETGGAAVTADTVFQAASLTKQVTAYAAFALRAKGKLDFNRPLVAYVDDIKDARSRRATIRHVLSHTAGFPNWRFEAGQGLTSEFEPGERWRYSGEGYFYLQRVLEAVTGQAFGTLIQELVFAPLGMSASAIVWMPEWQGRYAVPHRRDGKPFAAWDSAGRSLHAYAGRTGKNVRELRYEDSLAAAKESGGRPLPNWLLPNAAASMVTTANDYGRFVRAAIRNRELRAPQVTIREGEGWMLGWGLGWGIERTAKREFLWQWGDNGGFKNIVFLEPDRGDGVFAFTNGDAGTRVYDRVVTHVTGTDHPALFTL